MKLHSIDQLAKLIHWDPRFSSAKRTHFCGKIGLNEIDLQFHTGDDWIYGYTIYFRSSMEWPIIGAYNDPDAVMDPKLFLMWNEEDCDRFGKACLADDPSIFTERPVRQMFNLDTDDWHSMQHEITKDVELDESIFHVVTKYDNSGYTLWKYPEATK